MRTPSLVIGAIVAALFWSGADAQEDRIPPRPPRDLWDRFPKPRPSSELVGPEKSIVETWSADGRFLSYMRVKQLGPGTVSRPLYMGVVSARDRTERHFEEQEFAGWLRAHPDAEPDDLSNRLAPREVAEVRVEGEGRWVEPRPPYWDSTGKSGSTIRCSIRRGDQMLDSHVFQIPRGAVESRIDVYWSPDARRIAWFFSGKVASGDEGETVPFDELVIDRAVGPRIEITGEKGLGPEALDRVADAIETAGFAPTGQRVAKAGAKTIVYAVKRWSAQASQIASAVPGGAEVKALAAPKGGFEVVVALGRTAAAAMKR